MICASPTKDFTIRKSATHDARSKLCEQIGEALRCLGAAQPSDARIHEARKAIKRSRATLRLLRPTLSDRTYRLGNEMLRGAAEPLSAMRDARVLLESLDDLVAGERLEPKETIGFRAALEGEQRDVERDGTARDRTFDRTRAALHAASDRIAHSKLDSRGWRDLGDGIQRVYARGRKALRAARARCTTECLHEWRKQSKYRLYQLQLLQPIAPGPLGEMAHCAHRLSNRLGDDRDLTVLRQKASAHRSTFRARGELDALNSAIEHRQSRARVSHTMSQFKKYIERRGAPPGGWRGEICGGETRLGAGGPRAADSRIEMTGSESADIGSPGTESPATPGRGGRSG